MKQLPRGSSNLNSLNCIIFTISKKALKIYYLEPRGSYSPNSVALYTDHALFCLRDVLHGSSGQRIEPLVTKVLEV